MAQQPTVTQASQSGLISITNKYTKKIEKIASLASLQIGMPDLPAKLQLFGDLILKSSNVTLDGGVQYTIPQNTTFVNIDYSGTGAGPTTIILPKSPIVGQLVIIKDFSGDAATVNLMVTVDGVISIDGSTTATISTNYGALQLFWNGSSWSSVGTNSAGGGGGSGDVVGPASATDNAIARFNLTTGKLIQNSAVTIADTTGDITTPGDIAVNGGDITTTFTTANVFNANATTLNIGGAATTLELGAATGTTSVNNALTVDGASTFTGKTTHAAGLSGSLTKLTDGTSYLIAGTNVTIASASNGAVTISSTGGGGGAPTTSQYVTLALDAALSAERVLTAGTGLALTDAGANSTVTLAINDSVVATVSGTTFTGITKHNFGLSGSLTRLIDGTSAFVAGTNVTITSASNGAVTISSTDTGADSAATYVVLSATSSLPNERILTAGSGISIFDAGAGNTVTISATAGGPGGSDTQVQFNDGGSSFGGDAGLTYNKNTDTLTGVNAIFSGDLTVNGTTTTINTTNLEVKDNLIGLGFASGSVAQTNGDRGIIMSRQGGSGNRTFYWSESLSEFAVVASTTPPTSSSVAVNFYQNFHAANIQGDIVSASNGFSGSLTRLLDGTSYLVAGTNVTITSASNGAVTINASSTSGAPSDASYVVLGTNATLTDERVLTAGTGLTLTDGGANGNVTLAIQDSTVATISGSRFTGNVISATDIIASGTFKSLNSSGDEGGELFLNKPITNTSIDTGVTIDVYQNKLRIFETGGANRGGFYDITTLSAGVGTDLAAGGGGGSGPGDANATYVVMSATGSLNAERVLTAGTGLILTDGGANSNATLAVNDSIVATVSGTTFTGPVAIKTHSGYRGSETRTITAATTTTDATTTTIATISGSAGGPGTVYWVEGFFTGHNGTNTFGMAQRHACFYVNSAGTSVNQQGSTNNTVSIGQFPGSWSASLSTSGANIIATVTGQGGTTIDWAVTLRYQAVSGSA